MPVPEQEDEGVLHRLSGRTRLVAALFAAEALLLSLLVWQSWTLDVLGVERQVQRTLRQFQPLLTTALAPRLLARDEAGARRILGQSIANGPLSYAIARDRDGNLLALMGPVPKSFPAAHRSIEDALDEGVFTTVMPLAWGDKQAGTLYLGIDLKPHLSELRSGLEENIFRAVAAFALSFLLFLLVIRPLGLRLGRLQRNVERIAAGDRPVALPEEDSDEIGRLARAFKSMTDEVEKRELQLRETLMRLQDANLAKTAIAKGLDTERSRLLSLLSSMSFGVVFIDPSYRVLFVNPSFSTVWGLPANESVLGLDLFSALDLARDKVANKPAFTERLFGMASAKEGNDIAEVQLESGRALRVHVSPVNDSDQGYQGAVVIAEDVSQVRESQRQLAFLAERDPLTGLYNRRRFERELADCLEAKHRRAERVAVFFFDIDEFKSVNDMFGHRMGDAALQQLATEVRAKLRASEFFARVGGDEFALIVSGVDDNQVAFVADRLTRIIGDISVTMGEVRISLTSSAGIAICPDHSTDPNELMAFADSAMYQAKDAGKNTWRIYRPDHSATLRQRALVTWNDRIRQALRNAGFQVYLQGIFHAAGGTRSHSEALLRMVDESGHLLGPGDVIAAAEKSNLIIDVDQWMLRTVIEHLGSHPNEAPIAVNISGRSFDEPQMAPFIAGHLARCEVDPARLHLEITETAAIRDIREARRFIDQMHTIGCKVCLDDFGAGFATFAYIKELPVDVLKIDGLFVRSLASSRENQVFVKGMLEIARGIGKLTVAEAVEDEESLRMLQAYGVDLVQGFVLERPKAMRTANIAQPAALAASG